MVEDLKVTWGIGGGLNLKVYISILSWTGIILSAVTPLIGLSLLAVLTATKIMTLQILVGEIMYIRIDSHQFRHCHQEYHNAIQG